MGQGYPVFALNNTYGIELYGEEVFEQVMELILQPETGCNALIDKCRLLANEGDPLSFGMNQTVNAACGEATNFCFGAVQNMASQHSDVSEPSGLGLSKCLTEPIHSSLASADTRIASTVRHHVFPTGRSPSTLQGCLLQPGMGSRRARRSAQLHRRIGIRSQCLLWDCWRPHHQEPGQP